MDSRTRISHRGLEVRHSYRLPCACSESAINQLAQILRSGAVGLAHTMGVNACHLQAAVTHALTHGRGRGHRSKLGRREVAQPVQRIAVAEASGQLAEPL